MTLIEAIKSGKRFRQTGDTQWIEIHEREFKYRDNKSTCVAYLLPEEILADNWEVEEPAVNVTRTQFYEAAAEAIKEHADSLGYRPINPYYVSIETMVGMSLGRIAKKLGLE